MRQSVVVFIVYLPKSRVIIWRAARCLRCDRLSSPPSVIFRQLVIRADKMSHSYHHSLPVEVESDGTESYEMSKIL